MTATADPHDVAPVKKGSKLPLILGVVLALAGAAGGFYAVQSGLLGGGDEAYASNSYADGSDPGADDLPDLGTPYFVPLDTIIVNLPPGSRYNLLRFTAQLDVPEAYVDEVTAIQPRIVDVLNGYLRAVEVADLEDRSALTRLRSQMLRRVQVVTGEGRVRDLLVNEFVFN